ERSFSSTRALVHLLHEQTENDLSEKITDHVEQIQQDLNDSQVLANWEREKELVKQIRQGLDMFEQSRIQTVSSAGCKHLSRTERLRLAGMLEEKVLAPSTKRQKYTTVQVEESDRKNRGII